MIIDVDIGNTRLKWRQRGQNDVSAVAQSEWPATVSGWQLQGVTKILASCVAGPALKKGFASACEKALGVSPHFVAVQDGYLGLNVAYKQVESLGVDRWLAMLAASQHHPGRDLTVVCAGSALTVDYLAAGKQHLGGLIVPGVDMSFAALSGGTDQITQFPAALMSDWSAGDTTQACVTAGISALFKGFLIELQGNSPFDSPTATFVLAGGNATELASILPGLANVSVMPSLVLDGLGLMN